jgi:Trehalase
MKYRISVLALALLCTLVRAEENLELNKGAAIAATPPRLAAETATVPADWRAALPEPVLGQHKQWVDFYYDTWRIADLKKTEHAGHTIFDTAFAKDKIWLWDTVWISHFGVYAQGANPAVTDPLAGFDLFYSAQREDGCIPHVWDATGKHSYKVHNPIFTLGELNYYLHTGDPSRLATVLPKLDRFYFYMKQAYGEADGLYRNFDWRNGMDNRPIADISIDSTCEQAMVAAQLKQIAELVGDAARAAKFDKEYTDLRQRINTSMWSQADQFYTDLKTDRTHLNVWSVASYWALISGVADKAQAASMKGHLFDEANFKTPFMVPTLGRKSPFYDATGGHYWNGAVWIPTNTMVIKGLKKYGYINEAREIAISGLEGMYQTWIKTGTLWENYDQENPGKPGEKGAKGKICRTDFVGWSGVQPIATLIETIIGIQIDAPESRIEWNLRMTEQNGVRNLKWGPNYSRKVDLIAEARTSADDEVTLSVSSDTPFILAVDTGYAQKEFKVLDGKNQTFVLKR